MIKFITMESVVFMQKRNLNSLMRIAFGFVLQEEFLNLGKSKRLFYNSV